MKQAKRYARNIVAGACMVLALSWTAGISRAGTSWLDKGSDLLKSLGGGNDQAETSSGLSSGLSLEEIVAGLKQALKIGSENVVKQLGTVDGFNKDELIHIPLPENLSMAKNLLDKAGFSSLTRDLELKLNRAAEAATPKAKQLFLNAISQMSFEDARSIYKGADDAATQYFKEKMSPDLAQAMEPVIEDALSQVQAVQAYDTMMENYKSLPFVPDVKADLTGHVIDKGMEGIFYYMAEEEKAIRQDPVKRTTELLRKLFK
ncbi:DUF4197 domain-containing protein [Desulfospira joergensenii]|uniref:DUF4197 domain-containing protein n=1 Tax=Desulfospira joergensenii TaxID=53329 RepID=UPI0003B30367|nr:DUF4197 domain-containing protein [Desulfospira joergensenii]